MNAENLLDQQTHFAFGENWLGYAGKIDDARINQAVADLQRLAGVQEFSGKTFLDIGCGSGLHAVAALRMGAQRVLGVDIDPDSVKASSAVVARFAPSAEVQFEVCSVFDMAPAKYGTYDIVYSWGVLHHTGDLRRAVTCAAALVAPDGELLLALYKKTPFCGMWRVIKRWYSRSSSARQQRARNVYVSLRRLASWAKGRDFDTYVQNYATKRGMDFHHDVHDWLGGYPYQSISPDACHALLADIGFAVAREFINRAERYLPGLLGSGCDEYAFRRKRGT